MTPTLIKAVLQSPAFYHHSIALLLLESIFKSQAFTLPFSSRLLSIHITASKKCSSKIYSSFPRHKHQYNEEYDYSSDNAQNYTANPQIYRRNYNRLGTTAAATSDRQRMIMNSLSQNNNGGHEDEEWESYLEFDMKGNNVNYVESSSSVVGGDLSIGTDISFEVNGDKYSDRISFSSFNRGDHSNDVNVNIKGERSPELQQQFRTSDIEEATQSHLRENDTIDRKPIPIENGKEEANYSSGMNGGGIIADESLEGQQIDLPNNNKPITGIISSSSYDVINGFRQQFTPRTRNSANNHDHNSMQQIMPTTTTSSSSTKRRRITTEDIEYIKSTIPLTNVIESYNLKSFIRTNSHNAKACCPFHDDNNPSMSIDDNRGLYKCFACGAGGDVFNFIREYDYLASRRRGEDKMGYMQAVEYAAREFGDSRILSGWNFGGKNISDGMFLYEEMISEGAKEKIMERQRKKERIRQANTAAAAFFTKCLVTLSTAGKARSHLRSRNISPESVREFALGYAPDCYYGDEASSSSSWGEGSLVNYLADMEFTPDEIVEAGLAVRTKKTKTTSEDDNSNQQSNYVANSVHDYSSLMDRFRSRLIIPILDDCGEHVIAFGGRHIGSVGTSHETTEDFTPAKYINSPDSLVFTKKNILFNKYRAEQALNDVVQSLESSRFPLSTFDAPKGVVIVEGYFDAIALSNVGVKNVVACMGTALPLEQLQLAAAVGKVPGSCRIILCMDGDEAGKNAVARLSSVTSVLSKSSEVNFNELYVATLPDEIKDPSDFVDYAGGGITAKRRFEEEVLGKAIKWIDWYIERILSQYDTSAEDGTKGSFSEICDEVSTFLAALPNPAERTRRVYKIAENLVDLISPSLDKNSTSSSMMRVQLEADILNMATRKAAVREAMERRIEQADGFSGDMTTATMKKLAAGGSKEENTLLSANALARMKSTPKKQISSPSPRKPVARNGFYWSTLKTTVRAVNPPERHFVPHFSGFTFEHKSDRDWLGLTGVRNGKMHLGSTSSPFLQQSQSTYKSAKKDDVVYFNSNRYFGQQFITPEAIEAGYTFDNDFPLPEESIADFIDRKILTSDADQMIKQAESRLLHALAKFPQARAAMRSVYSTSTFGPKNMRWTSQEREWLFLCLTGSSEVYSVPSELLDGGTPSQLSSYLSQREDCPENAFRKNPYPASNSAAPSDKVILENELDSTLEHSHIETAPSENFEEKQGGVLDEYFLDDNDLIPSLSNSKIAQETRAELTVQETVAALLRATALKRFSSSKSILSDIVHEMDRREREEGRKVALDDDGDLGAISSEELQEMFMKVGSEVVSAQKSLYEAERSCDRVNSHLLDCSVSTGVQYKLSQASVERLNKMMDDHIADLPEDTHRPDTPGDDASYVFGNDEFDENVNSQYGGKRPDVFDPRLHTR